LLRTSYLLQRVSCSIRAETRCLMFSPCSGPSLAERRVANALAGRPAMDLRQRKLLLETLSGAPHLVGLYLRASPPLVEPGLTLRFLSAATTASQVLKDST